MIYIYYLREWLLVTISTRGLLVRSFKEKKNHLATLIKKVSDHHGGDDIEWLRIYAQEIISANINQIDEAILCFEDLLK